MNDRIGVPVGLFNDPGEANLAGYVFAGHAPEDEVALVDYSTGPARQRTYLELRRSIAGLAAQLREAGLGDGDVVAVLTENSAEFVTSYFGILAAGGVVLPLDPRAPHEEWRKDVAECAARAMVVDTTLWPYPPELANVIVGIGEGVEWQGEDDLQPTRRGGDHAAVLLSSSGTQGQPKKVVLTHRNLTAGLAQIETVHRLAASDAVMCAGPLWHIYGMQMAMNPALRAGGTLVVGPIRFDLNELITILAVRAVTVAYLVPSVISELAASDTVTDLPKLRMVVSGGGPLPTVAAEGCAQKLSRPVVQGFGMTEAGCVAFTPDDRQTPRGSVGVILPGTEVRFADPATGEEVPPGQAGELLLRGPQMTPGYLDPAAAPVRDEDGWFRTGDLALRDVAGFVRIVGRLKALIKYKGHQVAPAQLEDILLSHPAVTEALVLGEPDDVAGEVPKAFVVAARDVSLREITSYVAAQVAPPKRVRLIERVTKIPRSAMGKPLRPPTLRVVVLTGTSAVGPKLAGSLTDAGMSVLCIEARDDLADDAEHIVNSELGGVDVVVDAAAFTQSPPIPSTSGVIRALARVMSAGGRIVIAVHPGASRTLLGAHANDEAADRLMIDRLAAELSRAGLSVVGFDPGELDPVASEASVEVQQAPEAIVAIAWGAADHLSGRLIRPGFLESEPASNTRSRQNRLRSADELTDTRSHLSLQ